MKSTLTVAFFLSLWFLAFNSGYAGQFKVSPPVSFKGAVDCSAAVDVGDGYFVGASDENNVLRLYQTDGAAEPKKLSVDIEGAVKRALGVEEIEECDIEGAAKIGELIFWIGSHGRNKKGEERKERQVLFATKLTGRGRDAQLEMAGEVYTNLLNDLTASPQLTPFNLGQASTLAPKKKGALNIESLAADGDKLWIGFRNPQVKGNEALLIPLLNPAEIIKTSGRARLGEPVTLKLEGLGVRDMVLCNRTFIIIGGDFKDRFEAGAKPSRLFSWNRNNVPEDLGVDLGDLNPEAIVVAGQGNAARILILSDDGKYPKRPNGVFRGVWLQRENSANKSPGSGDLK